MFIKKLWIFLLLLNFQSLNCWSSRTILEYIPNGEESIELLNAIKSLNNEDKNISALGYSKIEILAENGDCNAFSIICIFKKSNNKSAYNSYIKNIYEKFEEQKNYSALCCFGKNLLDRNEPFDALIFLSIARDHIKELNFSLEDLDYNFITAICAADPQKLDIVSTKSIFYERAWHLIESYLNEENAEYKNLYLILFKRLEMVNEERLINKIGHVLFNKYGNKKVYKLYINMFTKTPHLERLYRQRNVVAIKKNYGITCNDGLADKKTREEKFITSTQDRICSIAGKELLQILSTEELPQQNLKNFGVKKIGQLNTRQQNIFGRNLVYCFEDRLFPKDFMDCEEYINKYLPSKLEKKNFLVEKVLKSLKDN